MANTYDIGDLVQVTGTFTDSGGSATDPDVITGKFKTPAAVETEYVYLTDAELVKSGTGVYYFNISADASGSYYYRFEGESSGGVNQGGEETVFHVSVSEFA